MTEFIYKLFFSHYFLSRFYYQILYLIFLIKLIKLMHNISKTSTNHFATYYLHYKEKFQIINSIYNLFLYSLFLKLILLFYALTDYILKIIKLLCCVPKVGQYLFGIYYLYYRKF